LPSVIGIGIKCAPNASSVASPGPLPGTAGGADCRLSPEASAALDGIGTVPLAGAATAVVAVVPGSPDGAGLSACSTEGAGDSATVACVAAACRSIEGAAFVSLLGSGDSSAALVAMCRFPVSNIEGVSTGGACGWAVAADVSMTAAESLFECPSDGSPGMSPADGRPSAARGFTATGVGAGRFKTRGAVPSFLRGLASVSTRSPSNAGNRDFCAAGCLPSGAVPLPRTLPSPSAGCEAAGDAGAGGTGGGEDWLARTVTPHQLQIGGQTTCARS
jgi:hypothetical protein